MGFVHSFVQLFGYYFVSLFYNDFMKWWGLFVFCFFIIIYIYMKWGGELNPFRSLSFFHRSPSLCLLNRGGLCSLVLTVIVTKAGRIIGHGTESKAGPQIGWRGCGGCVEVMTLSIDPSLHNFHGLLGPFSQPAGVH